MGTRVVGFEAEDESKTSSGPTEPMLLKAKKSYLTITTSEQIGSEDRER